MDHGFSFLSTICFYRHVFKRFFSVHQEKKLEPLKNSVLSGQAAQKSWDTSKKLRFTGAPFNDIDNIITSLVKSDEICHICIQLANFRDIGLNHCLCDGTLRHFEL
jgi:hypothetical protein